MDSHMILFEIKKSEEEALKRSRRLEADYVSQLLREARELQNQRSQKNSVTEG